MLRGEASQSAWIRPALARVCLLAFLLVGGMAAPARALPGDPAIEPVAPADGAVLPPDPAGTVVTFTCPAYRFTDAGGGFALYGGPEYYSVRVSSSPALDADGRLTAATMVDQSTASADPALPSGQCSSLFSDGSSFGVHTQPGTYYWQVARICSDCGGYETGPVRSFRIAVQATPTLTLASTPYSGYALVAKVDAQGVPDGASVAVQQRRAGLWSERGTGYVQGGAAAVDVTLPKSGTSSLRAVVTVGDQVIEGAVTTTTVRKARGARRVLSRRDDGRWTGTTSSKAPITFTVSGKGTRIGKLSGKLTALCPAAVPGQFIAQLESFAVSRAKIAPDGRFLKTSRGSDGKLVVRIAGRLKSGRVKDGEVRWTDGLCTGTGTFTARR